jgi:sigma-B regulation protein RsbU (phosphoserine phosphatase)
VRPGRDRAARGRRVRAAAHYRIATPDEVGGDFYDLFPLGQDRWGLFLGDVCGKGARAAAITSMIRYTLRAAAAYDGDPATVLSTLNAAIYQEYGRDSQHFCTAIFGLLAPRGPGFTVTLANGGHPAPLLIRADGAAGYQPLPGGMLVGVLPGTSFTATTIVLAPGDTMVLYTDGLTEARTAERRPGERRYGDEALRAFAAGLGPTTAPAAVAAITGLLDELGDGLDDDTAILALTVPRPPGG